MKIREVKEKTNDIGLSDATIRILGLITEGDLEREMTPRELKQVIALVEAEASSERDEATEIEELTFRLKNILSGIDNAAEIFDNDLKTLE